MKRAVDVENFRVIEARAATRVFGFLCPDCGADVGLRAGRTRPEHFAHLAYQAKEECPEYNRNLHESEGEQSPHDQVTAINARLPLRIDLRSTVGLRLLLPRFLHARAPELLAGRTICVKHGDVIERYPATVLLEPEDARWLHLPLETIGRVSIVIEGTRPDDPPPLKELWVACERPLPTLLDGNMVHVFSKQNDTWLSPWESMHVGEQYYLLAGPAVGSAPLPKETDRDPSFTFGLVSSCANYRVWEVRLPANRTSALKLWALSRLGRALMLARPMLGDVNATRVVIARPAAGRGGSLTLVAPMAKVPLRLEWDLPWHSTYVEVITQGEERLVALHGIVDMARAKQVRSNWYVGYDGLGVERAYALRRTGAGRSQQGWARRFPLHSFTGEQLNAWLALLRHFLLSIGADLCSIGRRDARTRREVGTRARALVRALS